MRALLPATGKRAVATDEGRRIPDATVEELARAGVFRMLQPARYGGLESDPVDFYQVVRAISAVCCSTGWVA
ncbi:acyl-CoA dehydrogenase family protein, partial [Streptomyces sp. NRRL WC-3549]|uniref:acyl-CoA dehydrogenase family protein n=1 Tax=Streptomyces sp. NRRL WC-3549 TaxID=1463925 RepID=UPI001F2574C0